MLSTVQHVHMFTWMLDRVNIFDENFPRLTSLGV